jgi:hypothetical protein
MFTFNSLFNFGIYFEKTFLVVSNSLSFLMDGRLKQKNIKITKATSMEKSEKLLVIKII